METEQLYVETVNSKINKFVEDNFCLEKLIDEQIIPYPSHLIRYYSNDENFIEALLYVEKEKRRIDISSLNVLHKFEDVIRINNETITDDKIQRWLKELSGPTSLNQLKNIFGNTEIPDIRFSLKSINSIGWMQRLEFTNDYIDYFYDIIVQIAKDTNLFDPSNPICERIDATNGHQPEKKELTINHFLSVFNISCGIIDQILRYWKHLPVNEQDAFRPIISDQKLLFSYLFGCFMHDVIEDELLTKDEILNILSSEFCYPEIVVNIAHKYNSKNFDTKRDYIESLKIAPESEKKSVFLGKIQFDLEMIPILAGKTSDNISNMQSKVGKGYFIDRVRTGDLSDKGLVYIENLKEISEKYTFMKLLPRRLFDGIIKNNENKFGQNELWNNWLIESENFQLAYGIDLAIC